MPASVATARCLISSRMSLNPREAPSQLSSDSELRLPSNHRRLKPSQLEIDDPTVGSFIYLSKDADSPTTRKNAGPSHEIVHFGKSQESILILNDYKSAPSVATDGNSVPPIIVPAGSEKVVPENSLAAPLALSVASNSVKADENTSKAIGAAHQASPTALPLGDDDLSLLVTCPLAQVLETSPIRILVGLSSDSFEILEIQSGVTTLGDLASLPLSKATKYDFMKEIGVPPDIQHLVLLAQGLIARAKALRPGALSKGAAAAPLAKDSAIRNQPIGFVQFKLAQLFSGWTHSALSQDN